MLDQNINEHSTLKKSVLSITQLIVNQFIKTYKNKIKIKIKIKPLKGR